MAATTFHHLTYFKELVGLVCYIVSWTKKHLCYMKVCEGAFTWTPRSESNAHSIRFVSVHMNPLQSNAHQMRIESNPPPEVDWKRIESGLHYYS